MAGLLLSDPWTLHLCYPVILNPNTSPPDVSVSDDLNSVTSCFRRQNKPNPLPLHRNRMVLGSVGYGDGVHTWEIEVGNSRQWTLGVCFGLEGKPIMQPLTPENGFWDLRCDGDSYRLLATGTSRLNISVNPEVVRVKLECYDEDSWKKKRWRKVSFSDASRDSLIAQFIRVPLDEDLFPFVMPEKRSVPLHVVPANVILSFMERHKVLIDICFYFVMAILMVMLWKIDKQGR